MPGRPNDAASVRVCRHSVTTLCNTTSHTYRYYVHTVNEIVDLDQKLLDVDLELVNLFSQLRCIVGGHGAGDDRSRNATGATKGGLGWHKHVGLVLVFAEERQVENYDHVEHGCDVISSSRGPIFG